MVLYCPACGTQHIDAPEFAEGSPSTTAFAAIEWAWSNPPHRSHLCAGCGHIWRPADVPTNGVSAVKTRGGADSPRATPANRLDWALDQLRGMARGEHQKGEIARADLIYSLVGRLRRAAKKALTTGATGSWAAPNPSPSSES